MLATLVEPGLPTMTPEMIAVRRESGRLHRPSHTQLTRGRSARLEDRFVPGTADRPEVPVLVCSPTGCGAVRDRPGLLYIHGGGMVCGDNRSGLDMVLDWVEEFGAVAVSVEYRLAPEHPHPAPVEDCYEALRWTAEQADVLGVDRERLLVVGTSAGGGLAARSR